MTTYRNTHRRDPMPGTTARQQLKPALDASAYYPPRDTPGTIKPCRLIVACALIVAVIIFAAL